MSKKSAGNKSILLFYGFLALVFLIGFYLRAVGIFSNSFAFTYDVGRDLLEVQKIVSAHKIPLIGQTTGLGGLFYGPWWYYFLTPAFLVSRGSPQGIAFYMVFQGLLTIFLGYVFGRMISGRLLGATFAVLLSFSWAMIGLSSQIWNPNIAPLFVILVFICLFKLKEQKRKSFALFFALGFLLGFLLDAELVFGLLFFAGTIFVSLYLLRKTLLSIPALGAPLGFFVILFPRIFFEFRHNFIMTRSLFAVHSGDQRIFDLGNFFFVLPGRFISLTETLRDTLGVTFVPVAAIIFITSCFIFYLLRKSLLQKEKEVIVSAFMILGTFIVGSSIFARPVWGHYLIGLPVLYIFLTGIAAALLSRKNIFAGIAVLLLFSYININPLKVVADMRAPLWEGNAAVYRNQVAVIDYIYQDAGGRHFDYIAYTPVLHDYTYQYLFSWYGPKKYGYQPDTKKDDLFYVIIEPDPGSEWRITNWLKVREGDGKVLKQRTVKGGIMVQTRIH